MPHRMHHPPFPPEDELMRPPEEEEEIPSGPPDEDDASYFFHRIGIAERLQRKVFRVIFAQYGLHPSQGLCLITIIREPGKSQRELADRLHIERATLTVMVQKMEKAGLITRRPDPNDQRILRIYPTDRGCEADRRTHEACQSFTYACYTGMSQEQVKQMADSLRLFEQNIQAFYEDFVSSKEQSP